MGQKILVIVDLYDANSDQRDAFDAEMIRRMWERHPQLGTTYQNTFKNKMSQADAVAEAERIVQESVKAAGIPRGYAVCLTPTKKK